MKLYDQHLHSRHSVDSNADPVANCEQAVAAGLTGLTFAEQLQAFGFEGEAVFRERVRSVVPW